MQIELVGKIFKSGQTKTGKKYYNILVPRPDGQQDAVTLFSSKDYKTGQDIKTKVNAYIQVVNED